jgi:branched-chain amino acid transport system permease protein
MGEKPLDEFEQPGNTGSQTRFSIGRGKPMALAGSLVRRVLPVFVLALPLFVPLLLGTSRLQALGVLALIYALFAYSLFLPYRYGGMLSLAHGALWGIGGYTTALVVQHWGFDFWQALPMAMLIAAVAAVAIGIPAFRTTGLAFLIVTFAFGEFVRLVGTQWRDLTNGPNGLVVLTDAPGLGPIKFDSLREMFFLVLGFCYAAILVSWLVERSLLGRRLMAIRENQPLAIAAGVNVFRTKLVAFAISGAMAGAAGTLFQLHQKALAPSLFTAFLILQVFLAIILGGAGSLVGPLIGAFFVTFFPEFLNLSPEDSRIAYGVLLVVFILAMPSGIVGLVSAIVDEARHGRRIRQLGSAYASLRRQFLRRATRLSIDD